MIPLECGCPTVCQCRVRSSIGTVVGGSGEDGDPITVSLDIHNPDPTLSLCNEVIDCISRNLGPGLIWDPATRKIRIKVSEDAGNTLVVENSGIVSRGGSPACHAAISKLPTGVGSIVFGDRGAGVNTFPQGLLRSSRAAVDYALDGVYLVVDGLSDDTPVNWWSTVLDRNAVDTNYYNNGAIQLSKLSFEDLGITPWSTLLVAVRNFYGNSAHQWNGDGIGEAGIVNSGPMSGPVRGLGQIGGNTVAQVINQTNRQLVYAWLLSPRTNNRPGVVQALTDTIIRSCAQQQSIVISQIPANTIAASQAGIQTGYFANGDPALQSTTPDALKAAGIDWVFADKSCTDSLLMPYQQAGLSVILTGGIVRRANKARVNASGYRGVASMDSYYYKTNTQMFDRDQWPFGNYTSGQITTMAEDSPFDISMRGRVRNDQNIGGLGYLPRCYTATTDRFIGWRFDRNFEANTGRPMNLVTTILGWACPLPKPTSYSIAWSHLWDSLPAVAPDPTNFQNGLGLLVSLDDDKDVRDGQTPPNYYWVHQSQAGRLVIVKRTNYNELFSAAATTGNVTANTWYHFRVTVGPTTFVLERFDKPATAKNFASASPPVVVSSMPLPGGEPGPRGPYVAFHKHQDAADPFTGSIANFEYLSI